jgi:hypothetical protein
MQSLQTRRAAKVLLLPVLLPVLVWFGYAGLDEARSEPRPAARRGPRGRPPYKLPAGSSVDPGAVEVVKRWWVGDSRQLRRWAEGKSLDVFGIADNDRGRARLLAAQLLHELGHDRDSLELYLRILRRDELGLASADAGELHLSKAACLGDRACERAVSRNLRLSLVLAGHRGAWDSWLRALALAHYKVVQDELSVVIQRRPTLLLRRIAAHTRHAELARVIARQLSTCRRWRAMRRGPARLRRATGLSPRESALRASLVRRIDAAVRGCARSSRVRREVQLWRRRDRGALARLARDEGSGIHGRLTAAKLLYDLDRSTLLRVYAGVLRSDPQQAVCDLGTAHASDLAACRGHRGCERTLAGTPLYTSARRGSRSALRAWFLVASGPLDGYCAEHAGGTILPGLLAANPRRFFETLVRSPSGVTDDILEHLAWGLGNCLPDHRRNIRRLRRIRGLSSRAAAARGRLVRTMVQESARCP